MATIHFIPFELQIEAEENESLLSAARRAGITDLECCGMSPLCGECKVSVLEGEEGVTPMRSKESEHCRDKGFLPYQRLGCLARVTGVKAVSIEMERTLEGSEPCQKVNLES